MPAAILTRSDLFKTQVWKTDGKHYDTKLKRLNFISDKLRATFLLPRLFVVLTLI